MPKLSVYVEQQAGVGGAQATPQAASGKEGTPEAQAASAQAEQETPSTSSVPHLAPQYDAAAAKLREDYNKRVAAHGPRTFRWPDGSLRPEQPPPNPHAAANRQKWAALVQHCRTHGGDRSFERSGYSLRYGIGVAHADHAAFLQHIGLEPDVDAQGKQRGLAEGELRGPLDDPQHCFNTFYKAGAEAVSKNRRGRLL